MFARKKKLLQAIERKVFRGFEVPEDLAPLTDIDPNEAGAGNKSGVTAEEVESIWAGVEDFYRRGAHPFVSLCVRRHGEMILNRSLGYVKGAMGECEPVVGSLETPVCLFSSSKAVSAMLIHKLAEEGHVELLTPVSYYIPEFAAGGKANITIHDLLSHRAGVPGIAADVPRDVLYNPDEALRHICEMETLHSDGRISAYHAVTGGFVMAKLVEVTTGLTIQQYLDTVFRQPLGMKYFTYGIGEEHHDNVARHYETGLKNPKPIENLLSNVLGASVSEVIEISNSPEFKSSVIPSGNIYSTAEEACRFFQMMLDRGEWQGQRVLDPVTVLRGTREVGGARLDKSLMLPMRYSAGMMLGGKPAGLYGVDTHHAFGHLGFSNILCWADPQRDLAVSLVSSGKPVISSHIVPLLFTVLNRINKACEPCVDGLYDLPQYHPAG
ncbi:serine hydrolase domain-containing protein [Litorivivens sp.]|uniref:serine hydrolase domain-containing protein n=1 Tax=Litorivivens sp. TaxID=2020868 RepID=UPI0035683B57